MKIKKKSIENEFEIINILEMAKIVYSDGKMEIYKAIHKANEGVFTGRIINNNFVNGGFIPKESIKKIICGSKRKIRKRN
jgi:hypothetical protein